MAVTSKVQLQLDVFRMLGFCSRCFSLQNSQFSLISRKCRFLSSRTEDTVYLSGWVQSVRKHKELVFINIRWGNSLQSQQVVVNRKDITQDQLKEISFGASVQSRGKFVPNPTGTGQEFKADGVEVLGGCPPNEYPLKNNVKHSLEYLRQFPHLRAKSDLFSAIMRIRSSAAVNIINYLTNHGFLLIHTPILTSCDCEGAGDVFAVQSDAGSGDQFFNTSVNLTVSGQLHAEALAAGLSKVFTFGPTFRSDKSHTRRHLAEFYMLEAEMCFTESLEDVVSVVSGLYTDLTKSLIDSCYDDIDFVLTSVGHKNHLSNLMSFANGRELRRMSYTESVDVLRANSHALSTMPPKWGEDLQTEHEQFLVFFVGKQPLFITDYPKTLKAFYARSINDDLVSCFDFLVPGVGEVAGGSLREERYDLLAQRLKENNMSSTYQWYLDLRRFGTVPHGGFGIGFERYLQHLLNLEHIRDVIPFPRMLNSCPM